MDAMVHTQSRGFYRADTRVVLQVARCAERSRHIAILGHQACTSGAFADKSVITPSALGYPPPGPVIVFDFFSRSDDVRFFWDPIRF